MGDGLIVPHGNLSVPADHDFYPQVVGVNVHQTVQVDEELEIRAYYAGHVLGAAMFYARVGEQSIVYTGDYNMTPDRHLGAAWIEKLRPDVHSICLPCPLNSVHRD